MRVGFGGQVVKYKHYNIKKKQRNENMGFDKIVSYMIINIGHKVQENLLFVFFAFQQISSYFLSFLSFLFLIYWDCENLWGFVFCFLVLLCLEA